MCKRIWKESQKAPSRRYVDNCQAECRPSLEPIRRRKANAVCVEHTNKALDACQSRDGLKQTGFDYALQRVFLIIQFGVKEWFEKEKKIVFTKVHRVLIVWEFKLFNLYVIGDEVTRLTIAIYMLVCWCAGDVCWKYPRSRWIVLTYLYVYCSIHV